MLNCPRCHSNRIQVNHHAKKIGGAIGTLAGFAGGAACVLEGAEVGLVIGSPAGPFGMIAGAVLGGLTGGVAGCLTGSALGDVIDDHVLDNYHCLACCYNFNSEHR